MLVEELAIDSRKVGDFMVGIFHQDFDEGIWVSAEGDVESLAEGLKKSIRSCKYKRGRTST